VVWSTRFFKRHFVRRFCEIPTHSFLILVGDPVFGLGCDSVLTIAGGRLRVCYPRVVLLRRIGRVGCPLPAAGRHANPRGKRASRARALQRPGSCDWATCCDETSRDKFPRNGPDYFHQPGAIGCSGKTPPKARSRNDLNAKFGASTTKTDDEEGDDERGLRRTSVDKAPTVLRQSPRSIR